MRRQGAGKKFVPTPEQRQDVHRYAKIGVPHESIATIFQIDADTLKKHFKAELAAGKAECSATYRGTLYEMANVMKIPSAVIFYLKTKEGYRENAPTEAPLEKTQIVFKAGETRVSKQAILPDVKDGTND